MFCHSRGCVLPLKGACSRLCDSLQIFHLLCISLIALIICCACTVSAYDYKSKCKYSWQMRTRWQDKLFMKSLWYFDSCTKKIGRCFIFQSMTQEAFFTLSTHTWLWLLFLRDCLHKWACLHIFPHWPLFPWQQHDKPVRSQESGNMQNHFETVCWVKGHRETEHLNEINLENSIKRRRF